MYLPIQNCKKKRVSCSDTRNHLLQAISSSPTFATT